MSEEEVAHGKGVIASAGMILYRFPPGGGIEILIGRRRNKPWRNYNSIVFGGLIQGSDESLLMAAQRETKEETGGKLKISLQFPYPICTFGPTSFHHRLSIDEKTGYPKATRTEDAISEKYKFLTVVFAGLVRDGEPVENKEICDFRWVEPVTFAKGDPPCAFDQALALDIFYWTYKNSDNIMNQRIRGYFLETPIT